MICSAHAASLFSSAATPDNFSSPRATRKSASTAAHRAASSASLPRADSISPDRSAIVSTAESSFPPACFASADDFAVDCHALVAAFAAAVFSAAAAESPLESPSAIAAKVDADWTNAHGTAELSRLYTPNALVIKSTADRFEPAAVFAAAESTLKAQPDVTLTPISAERDGSVVHHIFRTCTAGGSCGNGYFRLEQQTRGAWKIATDVWTLTPYSK